MQTSARKKFRIILGIAAILFLLGIMALIGRPMTQFMSDPEKFQLWVEEKGIWGVLAFMGMNILQVLFAIIPGGPFEIGAGYAFGVLKGSIICDIAMTIGSVITFSLARKYGMKFVELFFSREKIESVGFLKANKKSVTILFLVFLLPGSPKDLISYAVGLSDLPLWIWVLINLIGRFPAILLSASSGSALNGKKYLVAGIMIVCIILLYIIGMLVYKFHSQKKAGNTKE